MNEETASAIMQRKRDEIDANIQQITRTLSQTADNHPSMQLLFDHLGDAYNDRFDLLRGRNDIDKAIEYTRITLTSTPANDPRLLRLLSDLGARHSKRFQRLGEMGDFDRAIEYASLALALTPERHSSLPGQLGNPGGFYAGRFMRVEELGDLEKAIEYQSQALELTPDDHPHFSSRLADLAVSLNNRFQRLGGLEDLEKAIEYESRALALTPDDHPDLSNLLGDIAAFLSTRFDRLGELEDLEKAIKYESRALALTPDGHPDLSNRLANLGVSHSSRFLHVGDMGDLEKAIEYESRAVALTPDGHPVLSKFLHNLGVFHGRRFNQLHHQDDIEKAIECISNVLELTPDNHPNLPHSHFSLAQHRLLQYEHTADPSFQVCHEMGKVCFSGKLAQLHQNLMLRSPLDKLHSHDPALAIRLQTVAAQLHHAGSQTRQFQALVSSSFGSEQVAQQHHRLAQEHTNLLSQARTLPGFEDFLQPIKAHGLVRAARTGPIVVITCHESRCDALIVMSGQDNVSHLPLPTFTGQKARLARQEMGKSMRNSVQRERTVERRPVLEQEFEFKKMLACVWYDVVKPVLDYLGYTNIASGGSLPHVAWCPTGILSFLPLHAAGDYYQAQPKTYDYVISSYTPTLTALLSSIPSSLSPNSRVLAIGQPHTPGHSRLPGTIQELAHLEGRVSGRAIYSQLIGSQATKKSVLSAMGQHDWVHLACHAHQNVGDPTQSGFFLHDGALDLASINRQSFKNKGLTYLSACQTATGDENLPDEAIHLASGMLMAGYSSVIATMWSVMDDDAPFVADKVYSQLMQDGRVGNGEAGKALHYAVAELREKVGEGELSRWVPYIHIGS